MPVVIQMAADVGLLALWLIGGAMVASWLGIAKGE